jgi:hypothetical protein
MTERSEVHVTASSPLSGEPVTGATIPATGRTYRRDQGVPQ